MKVTLLYVFLACLGIALLMKQVILIGKYPVTTYSAKPKIETDGHTLRFHVIGDFGNLNPFLTKSHLPIQKVASSMSSHATQNPISMVLTTGDNFYMSKSVNYLAVSDTVLNSYFNSTDLTTIPWFLLYGNHDCYTKEDYGDHLEYLYPFIYMPKCPWNMTVELNEFSVSFTFLPCDLICYGQSISYRVEKQCMDMKSLHSNYSAYDWIDQHLGSVSNDPKIKWKVVLIHYPIFSVSTSGADNESLKKHLLPLLVKHKVDLVISGHNHNMQYLVANTSGLQYKRQKIKIECFEQTYLKCNESVIYCENKESACESLDLNCSDRITYRDSPLYNISNNSIKKGSNLVQLIQGSGGATLDYLCPSLESPMAEVLFGKAEYGFSELTITKSKISMKFIESETSEVVYESTLEE